MTKTLVNRYNYKPFLSKTACSFYSVPAMPHRTSPHLPVPPHTSLYLPTSPCISLRGVGVGLRVGLGLVNPNVDPDPNPDPTPNQVPGRYFEIDLDIHTWSARHASPTP